MITLGLDPEFFVFNSSGNYVPTWDVCKGQDIPLPEGTLVADGAAMEFTVNPAASVNELVEKVRQNIRSINTLLAERSFTASLNPHITIQKSIIDLYGQEYNKCSLQIFGCNPTINIYDFETSRPDANTCESRTLGGHIHFGGLEDFTIYQVMAISAALDQVVAFPALERVRAAGAELNKQYWERRKLYGNLGEIRWHPDEGRLEYRALSALDIITSPRVCTATLELAYNTVLWVSEFIKNNNWDKYWKYFRSFAELKMSAETGVASKVTIPKQLQRYQSSFLNVAVNSTMNGW